MKRFLSMLLAIVMVFSMLPVAAFANTKPRIYFETDFNEGMQAEDTFTVTAKIENNPGFGTITMTLDWNSEVVRFEGFQEDDDDELDTEVLRSDNCFWGNPDDPETNSPGRVTANKIKGFKENGILFKADFTVLGRGEVRLGLDRTNASKFELKNLDGTADLDHDLDLSVITNLKVSGAPAITQDEPFLAITTNGAPITNFEKVGTIRYAMESYGSYTAYPAAPHYHITIPQGVTEVSVTHSSAQSVFYNENVNDGSVGAYGYIADLNQTVEIDDYESDETYTCNPGPTATYECSKDAAGNVTFTIPLTMSVDTNWDNEAEEYCFVKTQDRYQYAATVENSNYYPICFFTFEYESESGGAGGVQTPTEHSIIKTENLNASITVKNEAGTDIIKAVKNTKVYLAGEGIGEYKLTGFTVTAADNTLVPVGDDNTFNMPDQAVTVTANVEVKTYTIAKNPNANGTFTVNDAAEAETEITEAAKDATVYLAGTANDGYELKGFTVTAADGASVTVRNDNTFTMPNQNITVSAVFEQKDQPSTTNTITLNAATAELEIGATKTLVAAVTPEDAEILWTSDAPAVATVDEDGVVTAVAAGSATITATIKDTECSATCAVTVKEPATYNVVIANSEGGTVTAAPATAEAGETVTLTVTPDVGYAFNSISVTDAESNPVESTDTTLEAITYTFEMPASDVSVSAVFDELPNTITKFKVNHPIMVEKTVTVDEQTYEDINVLPLYKGNEENLIQLLETLVEDKAPAQHIVWSSSNESIAKIENGKVIPVAQGIAIITAKIEDITDTATYALLRDTGMQQFAVEVSDVPTGYTVDMPDDTKPVVGADIYVPVTVGSDTAGATFNAYDMTFRYDPAKLTLISQGTDSTAEDYVQGLNVGGDIPVGTIHVERYGDEKSAGSVAFTLKFQVMQAGNTDVQVISAKVGKSEEALQSDASVATLTDPVTQVISSYKVELPNGFTGDYSVVSGKSYTFTATDIHYDYTFSVTIGGEAVENAVTDKGNGKYTISKDLITGNVAITVEESKGKTYNVDLTGAEDLTGAKTAQYMAADGYTATLNPADGYYYKDLVVKIGGEAYTGYQTDDDNEDGKVYYTIRGEHITGDIVFIHTKTDLAPNEVRVHFDGDGAADIASNTATVATLDSSYSFAIDKKPGFNYDVTYKMGKDAVYNSLTATEQGYTIDPVTDEIWIKIEKVSDLEVTVQEYLKLNGKSVFLITATQTLEAGKILSYDGAHMYQKTYTYVTPTEDETTGEIQTSTEAKTEWSYLVIVGNGQTFNDDDAKAKITDITATAENLDNNYNVNESGIQEGDPVGTVDINDAQLVYDMYMNHYEAFYDAEHENMPTIRKFLRADTNGDKMIDTKDAAAVVAEIIRQKNTPADNT